MKRYGYVSKKAAILLRDLGYDHECTHVYEEADDSEELKLFVNYGFKDTDGDLIPTYEEGCTASGFIGAPKITDVTTWIFLRKHVVLVFKAENLVKDLLGTYQRACTVRHYYRNDNGEYKDLYQTSYFYESVSAEQQAIEWILENLFKE